MTISRVTAIHSSIGRSEIGDDNEDVRKSSVFGSIICSIGRCSFDTSNSTAVGTVAAVNWMTIEGQAGVGEVIDETKAASLKPAVGVGTTGWHKMPTINREVGLLMKQAANSNGTSWSE
jgi:hypothetical protein